MDAFKGAPLKQQNLSAGIADLFGRRPDHADGQAEFVRHFGRGNRCSNGRCGNNVMAARMADAGKTIVLGANCDVQRTRAGAGTKRRG